MYYELVSLFFTVYLLLAYYTICKSHFLLKQPYSVDNEQLSHVRILTYNIQRLPYLYRPPIDIELLMKDHDIVCIQENFCSIFNPRASPKTNVYGCIYVSGIFTKITDSGLCIFSKVRFTFIDFVRFTNSRFVDKFADKGFLAIRIKDTVIINTHLQSTYNLENNYSKTALDQLLQIKDYCKTNRFEKVIIVGDFNLDIKTINIDGFDKLIPYIPTHWNKMKCIFNQSAISQIDKSYMPYYYDGAYFKGVTIANGCTSCYDKYTDHLGVSFSCVIY